MSVINKDQNMRPALNETIDYLNENDFHAEIVAETEARISADTELANKLSAESSARESKDTELDILLQNEVTARAQQYDNLQAAIDNETEARTSADTELDGKISSEVEARTSADNALDIQLQNEQTARAQQYDNLQAAIDTETTQRKSIDESFQTTLTGFNTTLTAHQTTLDNITANVTLDLSQVIDGTYFLPLSGGILEYSPLLGVVLFGGMSVNVVTPCDHNTVIGNITDSRFKPKHDVILCEFITNTLAEPKRIYFVLSANGSIYCRYYASGQSITAGSTYRSTSNIWLAS